MSGGKGLSRHAVVPDVIRPNLKALFIGINPDPRSSHAHHHFANPANPFWRILHESGFTPRLLTPEEEHLLLEQDIGIINLISRTTRGIGELERHDIARCRLELARKLARYRPRSLVFVGITGYRMFSGMTGPVICGEQPGRVEDARVFVVPHPSGRNAHFRHSEALAIWRAVADAIQAEGSAGS